MKTQKGKTEWNAQAIKDEYSIKSNYESELLAKAYKNRDSFESDLSSFQQEFEVNRQESVRALTKFAVDDDQQIKDLDDKVWQAQMDGWDKQLEDKVVKVSEFEQEKRLNQVEKSSLGSEYHEQIKGRISDKEFTKIVNEFNKNSIPFASDKENERDLVNELNGIIKERDLGQAVVPKEVFQKKQELELDEKGVTEVAKPGRTYTGKVIEVGEDVTIQKTKSGKFVIHETENLPGIKEQDSNISARIIYDAGGKGDITAKSNDMAIGKEKEIEQKKSHEKTMER